MSLSDEPVARVCPDCGSVNPREASSCWLCYERLGDGGVASESYMPHAPETENGQCVMTWTTFVFLCSLALLVSGGMILSGEPGMIVLGIVFLLASAPILVRLAQTATISVQGSNTLSARGTIGAVLLGMVVSSAIALAATVMFVVTCLPIGASIHNRGGEMIAEVAGILAAGGTAYSLAWLIFLRKQPPNRTS